jgi:ABC-type nitrate/sulfonate/bicarbonate transport system substrate-binding protein
VPSLRVRFGAFSPSLPDLVADDQDFYAAQGLDVQRVQVPSAAALAEDLIADKFDVVLTSPDNVLRFRLSPTTALTQLDVRIVTAVDRGAGVSLIGRRGLSRIDELASGRVAVDAVDSGFALVLYDLLQRHGLLAGRDYEVCEFGGTPKRFRGMRDDLFDATILNAGFDTQAVHLGMPCLTRVADVLPDYLSTVLAAPASWIERQPEAAASFLAAWHRATRFVLDPAHQETALRIIQSRLGVSPAIAIATLASAIDPFGGLVPDGVTSDAHVETLLRLRDSVVASHQPRDGRAKALRRLVDSRYLDS